MLGYSGTNSTGVTIVNSSVSRTTVPASSPNSTQRREARAEQGTTIVGNLVDNNNAADRRTARAFAIALRQRHPARWR